MVKKILLIIAPAIAVIAQLSLLPALPAPFWTLNILVVYGVLALFLNGGPLALWYALAFGFVLDIYSPYPFGVYIVSLGAALALARLCLGGFFSNKSLYSLILLVLLATFFFAGALALIIRLAYGFTGNLLYYQAWGAAYWKNILYGAVGNVVLSVISFYVTNYFSNIFQPFFIRRNK